MKTKLILFIVLAGLTLCALPSAALISVVSTGSLNDTVNRTNSTYTLSFNAGAANKLIVSAASESAGTITNITYDGVALTLIPNTTIGTGARNRGIWYLDNPFSGGAANIEVSVSGTFNHMRLGVASIAGAEPGFATNNVASTNFVSLDVPVANSFVFAAFAADGTTTSSPQSPLVSIYAVGSESMNMAAGYANSVPAGLATYTFTNSLTSPMTSAAAFSPVPLPVAPVLVSVSPADNATNVAIGVNLVATFSETVVAGTGNVQLWQVGGGSPVESFDVTSSSQLTFTNQTLIINPTADLTPGVEYYVLIPATAVVDTTGGDAFAGISNPTDWSFTTDGTAPTLVSLNPADNATAISVVVPNLVVTFSESVFAGTGNIELWKAGGGSPVESFDVTNSAQLTFSGATLAIDPTANLDTAANYYVIIPATAVKDLSGNLFGGLTAATDWNFTTVAYTPVLTLLNQTILTNNVQQVGVTTFTYTTTFDPDDAADALVLMFTTEAAAPSFDVSFGSQMMTQAVGFASVNDPVGIYYLNNPSVASETVSVTINLAASGNINGLGCVIFALNNSASNLGIVPTAAVTNVNADTPLSIEINVPDTNCFVVAGYANSWGTFGADVVSPLGLLLGGPVEGDFGSVQGAFGYDPDVAAGNQTYNFTTTAPGNGSSAVVAFAPVPAPTPTNTFASWISNPAFGLAPADQDLGDDPDGDGNPNGVENFFGTNPGVPSGGLVAGAVSGNTFTFTHPQNATPASDLTASYQWSKDLASFLADGATDGAGTMVTFTTQPNTPSPGFTRVTATVTGTPTPKLFFRVAVTQN